MVTSAPTTCTARHRQARALAPTAVVLGYLTYGETFGWFGIAGFVIAVVGVALATRGET